MGKSRLFAWLTVMMLLTNLVAVVGFTEEEVERSDSHSSANE